MNEHDLHKVALNMISSALSAWVFGKILPKYHVNRYGARQNKVLYGRGEEVKASAKRAKKEAAKVMHEHRKHLIEGRETLSNNANMRKYTHEE